MKKLFLLTLAALLLTGCAEKWQKPGASEQDFEVVKYNCTSRSNALFPPLYRQVLAGTGYRTPLVTRCDEHKHSTTCVTTGGDYVPPSLVTIDDNEDQRRQAFRACLFENGWQPVP